jgi:hypothetical protein
MLASSVAAGAIVTVWRQAAHHQNPWKKYAMLAGGSALIGVAQHLLREEMGMAR